MHGRASILYRMIDLCPSIDDVDFDPLSSADIEIVVILEFLCSPLIRRVVRKIGHLRATVDSEDVVDVAPLVPPVCFGQRVGTARCAFLINGSNLSHTHI